jgi:2-polyprenyl-6-methoxyphenol hydroxylase-like FAD-dependent oxidoreductase
MQFYLNGYKPGDPFIQDPHPSVAERPGGLPGDADVLIIGCGPAGLVLAAQMANFPDIRTVVIDRKDGPLEVGQADGVACRTVELLEAFGLADRLVNEGYWVNEVAFWRPDPQDRTKITRTGRIQDVEEGLSEMPHVIVNQARMLAYLLEHMERSASKLRPFYGLHASDIRIDTSGSSEYPVTVTLRHLKGLEETGGTSTLRAKYVVGCDGARSGVRTAIGRELVGDPMNSSWGVMDVLAVTDFPDIRFKSLIQSASDGSIIVIPREGGYLVRLYVELANLDAGERVANRNITSDDLIAKARRILHPYTLDVKEIAWWSVYEIGQRLTDKFDDVPAEEIATRLPRVFIAGDACHTHSPKAGQGMNVSMQDAFNLGWKLASVLRQRSAPHLLHSYSAERQAVAKELIDFDREWAEILASAKGDNKGADAAKTQDYFVRHGRYTAGTATRYHQSLLTAEPDHQHLARGLVIGTRFHSAPVIRLADAKPVHLGHVAKADGRFRIFVFAGTGDPAASISPVRALCDFLSASPKSLVRRYTPAGADIDSVIDVRAVFQQAHPELAIEAMPPLLLPPKGRYGLRDYEKMFGPDLKGGHDIFAMRGIDRDKGCVVVVRPDQYVAHVLPLDGHAALAAYFDGFMLPSE